MRSPKRKRWFWAQPDRGPTSLAASLNHSTLNTANALGAWLGSVVLSAGYGYAWPSRVGAVLAVLGLGVAAISVVVGRRDHDVTRVAVPQPTREGVLHSP